MNYIRDVTIFVFTDGNFLKMATAPIGEGAIVGLFEDIPFRPPQSGHVTHVWDDLRFQNIFICVPRFEAAYIPAYALAAFTVRTGVKHS